MRLEAVRIIRATEMIEKEQPKETEAWRQEAIGGFFPPEQSLQWDRNTGSIQSGLRRRASFRCFKALGPN